jgi:hypothetical protein
MHKNTKHLHGGLRGFAAAAAIASLAVFGCSTNRTPGDGQPAMTAPASPSSTPGTSSGTNPPMASAAAEGISVDRANESAAILAAHQRERFLGTINPSGPQPNYSLQAPPTGQVNPPSMYANPEVTVNASISSDPTPVITSGGAGGDGAIIIGSSTTGTTTGTTAAATVGATTAATATPTTAAIATTPTAVNTIATPTTAAIMATPTMTNTTATPTTAAATTPTVGQFATGPTTTTGTSTTILTPTLTSAATPSPTRAANPPLATLRLTQAATTSSTTTASTTTASSTAIRTTASAPIRIITNANGTVTVTNTTSTPPTVIRNQR